MTKARVFLVDSKYSEKLRKGLMNIDNDKIEKLIKSGKLIPIIE